MLKLIIVHQEVVALDKFDCAPGGRLIVRRLNVAQVCWLGLLGQDGGLLCQLLIDPYLLIN